MKVVVTGMGMVSSLGHQPERVFERLIRGDTGVKYFPEWMSYNGLHSHVGAPVESYDIQKIPRVTRRAMSPMSTMATVATTQALQQSDWTPNSRTLICMGSTTGSPETLEQYFKKLIERGGPEGQLSTSFFKVMNHSVAANVAAALEFQGPLLSPSSACSTAAQALVLGWELIRSGQYDVVIAGGADELHYTSAAVFDIVLAASRQSDPQKTPRPFDRERDGLVVSEGAGVVILESEEHAKKRRAQIIGEFCGGTYRCDGSHMTQSNTATMASTMRSALERSGKTLENIDYVNAHATGTVHGDAQEAVALAECFGDRVPVSSLKGHFGHSLAPCGAFEVIMSYLMIHKGIIIPTRNLETPDSECLGVWLPRTPVESTPKTVLSNNFAFGGMGVSVVISSYSG